MSETEATDLLVSEDVYLTSGVHIGTQQKSANMKGFIFKVRNDGLYVLDVKQTDERIRHAARTISVIEPTDLLVVSARQYGQRPVKVFARSIGAYFFAGRFVPGTLTNPSLTDYMEPKLILLTDPAADAQALKEAVVSSIPVIALCDANNETRNVDLVIPANNKGRRSLAVVYWLLTREVLKQKGTIVNNSDYSLSVEDFEARL